MFTRIWYDAGVTQMMAMHAANQLHTVESVRVSHGSYRPIAFSASITETTTYEYDAHLPSRTVYENGEFKQVPPFARPRELNYRRLMVRQRSISYRILKQLR